MDDKNEYRDGELQQKEQLAKAVVESSNNAEILYNVMAFYQVALKENKKAKSWLIRNGISEEEMIEAGIGVADRTLGTFLPLKQLVAGRKVRERLIRIGLFKPSGHELFRGAIIVPEKNDEGEILQLYGYRFGKGLRDTSSKYLTLVGNHEAECQRVFEALSKEGIHGLNRVLKADGPVPEISEPLPSSQNNTRRQMPPISPAIDTAFSGNQQNCQINSENDVPLSGKKQPPTLPTLTAEKHHQIDITLGSRQWRIRGMEKNTTYSQLKVNLLVSQQTMIGTAFHVDTFDMYSSRHRKSFVAQAAEELGTKEEIIQRDVGTILLQLEQVQDAHIKRLLKEKEKPYELSAAEKEEALQWLKRSDLLEQIQSDFTKCGFIGEETNTLTGYIAAISRKLQNPLAVVIQSSSAAGKTTLMDAILSFVPAEDQSRYSAITGQSLFYLGEEGIKNKILAISEDGGAEKAVYALKLLQSEGELTIASTNKDSTGRLTAENYQVQGPVSIFLTTTAAHLDEELLNRAIVLTIEESQTQTKAIHAHQRAAQTIDGLIESQNKKAIVKRHQNAQRLLKPIRVVNPYAPQLTFAATKTRTRRDQLKYLGLIQSIAFLHQYQRERKQIRIGEEKIEYIEVTPADIDIANRLASKVLCRSLDELAPQTRRLLKWLHQMINEKEFKKDGPKEFTRRSVREYTGWSYDAVTTHLTRLVDFEYVFIKRGSKGSRIVYELAFEGNGITNSPQPLGLVNIDELKPISTATNSTKSQEPSGTLDPPSGAR